MTAIGCTLVPIAGCLSRGSDDPIELHVMNLDDDPHEFEFVARSDGREAKVTDTAPANDLFTEPDAVPFSPFEARIELANGNADSEALSAGVCEHRRVVAEIGEPGFVRVSNESCL